MKLNASGHKESCLAITPLGCPCHPGAFSALKGGAACSLYSVHSIILGTPVCCPPQKLYRRSSEISGPGKQQEAGRMTVAAPEAALSNLPKADGSATYSFAGYTITASVNGPIEAQRRDEHPYEALVDIIVRPASGVGGERFASTPFALLVDSPWASHALFRNQRTPSRVCLAVFSLPDHFDQELPPFLDPDRPPSGGRTGE